MLFSFAFINGHAQNTEKEEYLIARTVVKNIGKILLYIDYSEATGKDYIAPDDAVYDSTGTTIKFKSESAALNYLAKKSSWIMVSATPLNYQGSTYETKYIFKRKIIAESLTVAKPPTAE
jgi:chaperonin cofactor prefoldin